MRARARRGRDGARAASEAGAALGAVALLVGALALPGLGCGDGPSAPGAVARSPRVAPASAEELCGSVERECCPAPRRACAPGLRCDEGVCRVAGDDPDAALLCRGDEDCTSGRRCCIAGAYGTCQALEPLAACPLPDLAVLASGQGLTLTEAAFDGLTRSAGGCVRERGLRRRLRVQAAIANLGAADFLLGGADVARPVELGEQDAFLRYRLLDAAGATRAESHAALPCRDDADAASAFDCAFTGLAPGSLLPTAGLECEALDVTELPAGSYRLRVELAGVWPDADPSNGSAEVPVALPPFDPLAPCPEVANPLQGLDIFRECGWAPAALPDGGECRPGEVLGLDCERCTHDPLLRVCAGDQVCSAASAISDSIGFVDPAAGGGACASLQITCPSLGRYNVLIAAEDPTLAGVPCALVESSEFFR